MAEFERVPLRPRPNRNWLPTAGLAVAVFLALAIDKPWESSQSAPAGDPTPPPTFFIRPTERTGPRDYDPRLFGLREPDPAWELWPAGYVVQFGMAGPLKVSAQDEASPAPSAGGASVAPSGPSPAAATTAPLPPGVVDLGPADHLVALGINMPLDISVLEIRLEIYRGEDCCVEVVPIVYLPTLWESAHFEVIAPEDPSARGQPKAWDSGQYVLYLATDTGVDREIRFVVRPARG